MDRGTYEELVAREDLLASGDASQPSNSVQIIPSVLAMGMNGGDIVEEVSDDDDSSIYTDSTAYSTDQHLSPCPTALREGCPYPYPTPTPHTTPGEKPFFKFEAVGPLKDSSHPRANYIRTNKKYPSDSKFKEGKSATIKKPIPLGVQKSRSNSCEDAGRTLSLTEVSTLLSCEVCKTVPMTSLTVHCCANGHQACGHCFSTGYRVCMECSKPLEGRNEVLEKVLQRLRQVCPGLFPNEGPVKLDSELQLKLDEAEKAENSKIMERSKLVQHSTHRPVDCPHLSCQRVIAANGFLAHFQFEHPSVPVFEMSPDYAHQFGLSHRCFENLESRAIAIIEVNLTAEKCGAVRKYGSPTDLEKRATFLTRRDAVVCVLLGAAVQFHESVFLLAWCACLHEEETPLTYCLRATSPSGCETCYNGPASSLHHSQDPMSILQEAQCLFLSSGVFGQDKDCSRSTDFITLDVLFNLK